MAEKEDPFEAAMESMDELIGDDSDADGSTPDPEAQDGAQNQTEGEEDPFDIALEAMDGESDTEQSAEKPKSGKPVDPFEAAMNAMESGQNVNTATVEADSGDDPFAAALEIAKAEHKIAEAQKGSDEAGKELDLDFLMEIKLNLTFEVGRTKMYISDLLSLGQGSVIELHRLVGEELELYVNGQLLATGEVVVVNEKFGARITKILSPEERINHLGPQPIIV